MIPHSDETKNGLLLIDKPAGITSHDVVDAVRRIAKTRAVGHAGTLDPFATGLLILGINKATKWLTALVGLDKEYLATITLGARTDSYDVTGKIIEETKIDVPPTVEQVKSVVAGFVGTFDQKAPLFSAKKLHGKKLYELARAGVTDESLRPIKRITISELTVLDYVWPTLTVRISCSSGTYIRTLADDIGQKLGVGGYVRELRRTRIGGYRVEEAVRLSELTESNFPLIRGIEGVPSK